METNLQSIADEVEKIGAQLKTTITEKIDGKADLATVDTKIEAMQTDFFAKLDEGNAKIKAAADEIEALKAAQMDSDAAAGAKADDIDWKADAEYFSSIELAGGPKIKSAAELEKYADAFRRFNSGDSSPEISALMQTGIGTDGGFGIVPQVEKGITRRIFDQSSLRPLARNRTLSQGTEWQSVYETQRAASGWRGELASVTETAAPKLEILSIPLHELNSQPIATQWEVRMGNQLFDVENFLMDSVAEGQAIDEGDAFWVGNGINKPRGITDYTAVATDDDTRAWGQLQFVPTGVSGGFHATLPGDVFYTVLGKIKKAHRRNSAWFMNRATISTAMKFKDSQNNYIWQQSLRENGFGITMAGYPVVEDEGVPDVAANSFSVAFGNMLRGYTIVDKPGIFMIRDELTVKGKVLWWVSRYVGGAVSDFDAIKLIKFAV